MELDRSWTGTAQHHYFCDDSNCDVAYFGNDDSVIYKSQVRTNIGVKEQSNKKLLCYCFGVSDEDYQLNPRAVFKTPVQQQIEYCYAPYRCDFLSSFVIH
jgi:hypothetical protein